VDTYINIGYERAAVETTEWQAEMFGVLADPTRLKLVKLLCRQSGNVLCVNALAGLLGVTQSAVSQHLRVLRMVGLVKAERRGYHIHYFINLEALDRYRNVLSDVLRVEEPHDEKLCGNHCNKKEK
jgi:ArsR family transcriptional regulator, arsenate/arsenite/antimonite-responsive transcriptional repressor